MAMAAQEGWSTKSGSKWKTMPEQMMWYRAAAFWTRMFCPELSLGMQTAEEVMDVHGFAVPDAPAAIAPGDNQALERELLAQAPTAPKSEPKVEPAKAAPKSTPRACAGCHKPIKGEHVALNVGGDVLSFHSACQPAPIQDVDPETGEIIPPAKEAREPGQD